ncbi:hypothetical protein V3C99_014763, partial [Haemonchus contortus]
EAFISSKPTSAAFHVTRRAMARYFSLPLLL